jgi:hypothetical protein
MSKDWRVTFDEQGRDGYIHYEEGGDKLSFYWAFGSGNVVVSVAVGDEIEWRAERPAFAARREEIIARIAEASIREGTPTSRAETDETGRFLNFIAGDEEARDVARRSAAAEKQEKARAFFWRLNELRTRMATIALAFLLFAGAAVLAERSMFTIKTTGSPIGASARAGEFIATPIGRLQPYVPSLNRDHSRDRYSIGLLIHSARNPQERDYVSLATDQSGGAFGLVKIAGVAGELVWFDAPETVIVDARAARVLSPEETGRAPAPPRPKGAEALAALATAERRLEGLLAGPGEAGAPSSIAAEGDVHQLGFLRAAPNGETLRVGGDLISIFYTRKFREGALVVARVAPDGALRWRTETAIGALDEVLPDPVRPAFIGARPRVEGKVPEPLLVVIDAETGGAATHTLLVDSSRATTP